MATILPTDPLERQKFLEQLRANGATEEQIQSILRDPTNLAALGKMYDQSAYLRKAATAADSSKGIFGAVAQGLGGYMANQKDKEFMGAIDKSEQANYIRRRTVFDLLGKRRTAPGSTSIGAAPGEEAGGLPGLVGEGYDPEEEQRRIRGY
jgi:hypothetical protein